MFFINKLKIKKSAWVFILLYYIIYLPAQLLVRKPHRHDKAAVHRWGKMLFL